MSDDVPTYVRGAVRTAIIRGMNPTELLEEFSHASLKRITADLNSQEKLWDEYWYDLHEELLDRLVYAAGCEEASR